MPLSVIYNLQFDHHTWHPDVSAVRQNCGVGALCSNPKRIKEYKHHTEHDIGVQSNAFGGLCAWTLWAEKTLYQLIHRDSHQLYLFMNRGSHQIYQLMYLFNLANSYRDSRVHRNSFRTTQQNQPKFWTQLMFQAKYALSISKASSFRGKISDWLMGIPTMNIWIYNTIPERPVVGTQRHFFKEITPPNHAPSCVFTYLLRSQQACNQWGIWCSPNAAQYLPKGNGRTLAICCLSAFMHLN